LAVEVVTPRRRERDKDAAESDLESASVDAAWRIHQAQADWTGKVDAKASFAFAIESAAIATVVALTAKDRVFSGLDQWWLVGLYAGGLVLMLAAAGLAALVVVPRLRSKAAAREASSNFIYFGHVRSWSPEKLEAALRQGEILPQLSRQIIHMAEIAWRKHLRVQWSFGLAVAAGLCLVTCGLLRLI
jgi:hypothetical protein